MLGSITKLFKGDPLKTFRDRVADVNALEPEVQKLSDDALKAESMSLRERIQKDGSDGETTARAFALAREAARRTLGQRPYDEQLLGGLVLHAGAIAEMMTGEGKTLAGVAPAYANALVGKGVHVVTVNEYLARRDAVWMGQVYHSLGLTVACLVPNGAFMYDPAYIPQTGGDQTQTDADSPRGSASGQRESALLDKERDTTGSFMVQQEFLRPVPRREAYRADITYGTNHEFGFDYLRDNLAYGLEQQVQREYSFAIIDEVDSILIDEARTPLIIAAPDTQSSDFYKTFTRVVANLKKDEDYDVDEKKRTVSILVPGIEKVEQMLGVKNIYAPENLRLVHYLEESLRAKALYTRDKDYVVKNGEVIIVDEFTGRMLHGRRYQGGLHQAIEAKESVQVKEESKTYAKVSVQNYFRMYQKISGMTGTAQTSAEEFFKVYKLDVYSIPTHKPCVRADANDRIYKNVAAKWNAVVADIKERHQKGQPILVGTTSIEKNERLAALLSQAGIPHELLNAKNNEREGAIVAQAGRRGAVTIATNMAGRGVDIILGGNPMVAEEAEKVRNLGGLHVIGTERHEARRIDNQLRGRAGRQGDPGSSQFYLSLEDDLVRIFGGDRIRGLMERFDLPDDMPIDVGMVSKAVAQAQAKVEGANFDLRKHLLEYDDVLNKQRSAVYKRRQEILGLMNADDAAKLIGNAAEEHLNTVLGPDGVNEKGEFPSQELKKTFEDAGIADKEHKLPDAPTEDDLRALLASRSMGAGNDPRAKGHLLGILDMLWMTHLEHLEALSESVGLRAYGQHDPLVEYRREAHRLYQDFWTNWNAWVFMNLFKLMAHTPEEHAAHRHAPIAAPKTVSGDKIGRNDPCPCGSGKKYKKCHGA
jgi:preprotein translocase subunit SecA